MPHTGNVAMTDRRPYYTRLETSAFGETIGIIKPPVAKPVAVPIHSNLRNAYASRSTKSLFQLGRQGHHGGGGRVSDHQLRHLGHWRYLPWFRSIHSCQDRPH